MPPGRAGPGRAGPAMEMTMRCVIALIAAAALAPPAAAMPWGSLGVSRPLGTIYRSRPLEWVSPRGAVLPQDPAADQPKPRLDNRLARRVGGRVGGGSDQASPGTQMIGQDLEARFAKRYDTLP